MAVTHHQSSRTIRGITYNYGQAFTSYATSKGTGDSEGGGGTSLAIEAGETCYYYGYATGDSGGLTSNPYLIYDSLKNPRGWHKESIFPYAKYTISYNANGGTGAPSSQTKTYGTALTLSSTKPKRTGYTFSKWNTNSGGTGTNYNAGASYTANSGVTLYAQWTANTYTVTFNANGGSCSTSSKSVTYDSTYGTLPTPTRTGYTFNGWYTATSGGTKITSSTTVSITSAQTLYAQWTEHKLTVNYYSNYATYGTYQDLSLSVSASTNVKVHSQEFYYDNSYSSALSNIQNTSYLYLARIGYTPNGYWGTSITNSNLAHEDTTYTGQTLAKALGKDISNGNVSVNVYPQWTINGYTFNYNPNKGSGTMNSVTVEWNETFTIPDNAFKREGYKFVGWHVCRNADNTWYVVGQGWLTEDEIANGGYEKKLYQSQEEHVLGNSWVKGDEYTISSYTMYAQWEISGVVYIDNGTSFEPYLAYIDNGTDWELYLAYIDDGENWNIIS